MSNRMARLCATGDLAVGQVRAFDVDGQKIALYHIGETFYATDDVCTHGDSSLATGELQGENIECAAHFGVFHVPTGKVVSIPCALPLRTYRVEVRDDVVFVEI